MRLIHKDEVFPRSLSAAVFQAVADHADAQASGNHLDEQRVLDASYVIHGVLSPVTGADRVLLGHDLLFPYGGDPDVPTPIRPKEEFFAAYRGEMAQIQNEMNETPGVVQWDFLSPHLVHGGKPPRRVDPYRMVLNITNQTDEADSWIVLRGRDDDDMFLAAAALVNAQSATARLPDEDVDCRSPHLEHFQMFSWGERRPDAEARIQQLFYEHGETFPVTASEYGIEGRVLKVSGKRGLILPDGCDTPVTYMTDRMSPEVWFGDTHGLWKQSYAADPESRKVTFGERVCVTGIQDPATGWINGAVVSKIDLTSEAPSP